MLISWQSNGPHKQYAAFYVYDFFATLASENKNPNQSIDQFEQFHQYSCFIQIAFIKTDQVSYTEVSSRDLLAKLLNIFQFQYLQLGSSYIT